MISEVIAWVQTMRLIEWIEFIASICSIVALPIAIWQIHTVKSKVETTEAGIHEILNIKQHQKYEEMLAIIKNEQSGLVEVRALSIKPGSSDQNIIETIDKIVVSLNKCLVDMPLEGKEVSESLRGAIEKIRGYSAGDDLKDAEDYLYSAIQQLKKLIAECYNAEVKSSSGRG